MKAVAEILFLSEQNFEMFKKQTLSPFFRPKFLFQMLQAIPETITEDFCGIEPVTLPPEEEETRRPPQVDEKDIQKYYSEYNAAALGSTLVMVIVAAVIVGFAVYKYKNR